MNPDYDELFAAEIDDSDPGAVVAVIDGGSIAHIQGYGLANVEWNMPNDSETVFRLASITKQFTSTAIMMLEEAGKLSVEDPLTRFVPDYPTSGHDIRIHHLLNHTSGVKSYTSIDGWFPKMIVQDMTPQEIQDQFSQIPFDFKPGTRSFYNNSGYHLLGMIIEQVSGMDYATFVQTEIFSPLAMNNSYYMHNASIIPTRANGYSRSEDGYRNADYVSMTHPYAAGSLGATVDDLMLWAGAVYSNRLISQETQERMWAPTVLADGSEETYGYGWGIGNYRDHAFVHHSGGIPGFSTFMAQFRDEPLTIIVLANREDFDSGLYMLKAARVALGLPEIVHKPVKISSAAQESVSGKYLVDEAWTLEILKEDDNLYLKTEEKEILLPLSESTFYVEAEPETEYHFSDKYHSSDKHHSSDKEEGKYRRLVRVSPLYSFTAYRSLEG